MMKENRLSKKKLVFATVLGNFLEWYDFSLYGFFATILSDQFFPSQNKFLSLCATFAVLAIGYLIRPLGGIFFGHLGDRYGRKTTLATTIVLMATSTSLIGLLPTYAQIGLAASLLLMACRMIQGFALGGEYSGSMVYLIEHAPENRRGFFGGFVLFGTYIGFLFGSGLGSLIGHLMPHEQFISWGWRLPFLFGSVIGVVGYYIRQKLPETPHFEELKLENNVAEKPLNYVLKHHWKTVLKGLGIMLLPAVSSYLTFVYFPNYLVLYAHISLQKALLISTGSTLVMIISIPILGILSEYLSQKFFLILSALLFVASSYFLCQLLLTGTTHYILLALSCFAVMVCMCESLAPAILANMFSSKIRYTGVSLPINIGNGVFGGTAPLVVTFLIHITHEPLAPAFYLIAVALISLYCTLCVKK